YCIMIIINKLDIHSLKNLSLIHYKIKNTCYFVMYQKYYVDWCKIKDNIEKTLYTKIYNVEELIFSNNITHIIFSNNFNKRLENLPSQLQILKLGEYFNQKLENLPNQLQKITLG